MRLLSTVSTFFVLFLFNFHQVSAQRYFSVVFTKLPADMQLFARDDDNNAEVGVEGYIELAGWHHMSLVTFRNKERVGYAKSDLAYGGKSTADFALKTNIKAEMADYEIEVYAVQNETDSVLIVRKTEIVAGDFFLISGQSNGAATTFGNWSSKYCRTIARIPDSSPAITPADTNWIQAAWSWTYVGAWGLELQRYILENEGIPTCVINGSIPGKKISEFLVRDESYHKNPTTLYGLLLYRLGVARASRVRAFFWVHGEQEVFENISGYDQMYDQLFKNWTEDYPTVEKFINLQTNVIVLADENKDPKGGQIRDFLRRTKYLYPKSDHFSPIGVPGYDGVHYSRPGYEEYGHRVFQFIRPSLYGTADSAGTKSPDIKKAFFTSTAKNEIKLVFDSGQELRWASDTTIKGNDGNPLAMRLKNFFYLDGDESKEVFTSGSAAGNEVILKLKEVSTATKISYLPAFYIPNLPILSSNVGTFNGPYLTNRRGFGAFSFDKVAVGEPLLLADFSGEPGGAMVVLKWSATTGASGYILERKVGEGAFKVLKTLDKSTVRYDDFDVQPDVTYTYRLRATSDQSESLPKDVVVDYTPVLGTEPVAAIWNTFPNPFSTELHIEFNTDQTGLVEIFSSNGQWRSRMKIEQSRFAVFSTLDWPVGLYIVSLTDEKGKRITHKIMKVK